MEPFSRFRSCASRLSEHDIEIFNQISKPILAFLSIINTESELELANGCCRNGDGNDMGKRNLGMEMEFKNRNIEEKMIKKRQFCEKHRGGIGIFWLQWIRYRNYMTEMDKEQDFLVEMNLVPEFCD